LTETNKKFAAENQEFRSACEAASIEPSKRQASKWRNKKGKAYKKSKGDLK